MSTHKWYAIQTYAGSEVTVKRVIENLVKDNGIEEQLRGIVVPTEDVIESKNGEERISERSLCFGYVFAHLDLNTELWRRIQSLPKVGRLIGESRKPTPLAEKDISLILEKVHNRATPKPKISLEEGENARIAEDPFINFTVIVEEHDMVRGLLKLDVFISGCSTPVEISYSQVGKII